MPFDGHSAIHLSSFKDNNFVINNFLVKVTLIDIQIRLPYFL